MDILWLCVLTSHMIQGQIVYDTGMAIEFNDTIKIEGNGFAAMGNNYNIRFRVDNEIAFLFNPRWIKTPVVVRNSWTIAGGWGTEETGGGVQLSSNALDPIDLEFKFTATKWEVS
eukprot:387133_1